MATTVIFGNKICKLPGSYARVVSGIPRETPLSAYNNFLLIDAGFGNGFNSIPGIKGHGKERVYSLSEEEANYYVKGGPLEPVISALFHPDDNNNKPGIGTLYLIKAALSAPASTSGSLFSDNITFTSLKTVEEGVICNTDPTPYPTIDTLKKGFLLVCKYDINTKKGWIELWQGGYRGTNYGGFEIGNTRADSNPILVYRSKKCLTTNELVDYLNNPNSGISAFLEIKGLTSVPTSGPSNLFSYIYTEATENVEENHTFSGGNDTYTNINIPEILNYTLDSDYSCMMIAEANGATNYVPAAIDHILNDAKGIKQIIAAKETSADAILFAKEMDTDSLIVTANQGKNKNRISSTGFIDHDFLVTAAKIAGRIFGLSPEIPGTLKSLGFDGMVEEPSDAELEDLLDAGVITPYYDSDLGYYCMSQAVNSLQRNSELINDNDCSTFSVQCKRLLAQVVKNLVQQSKIDFWGSQREDKAANKGNLSEAYVKAWTETLLNKLSVAPNKTENNYLITYEVTKVEIIEDYIRVYISVTVNGEITKVFFLVTVLG